MSIDTAIGPVVGTASLKVSLPSPGFLSDLLFVTAEIGDFVEGMAFDNLLDNIRLIAPGAGHVVTHADERLTELRSLAQQGFKFVLGGGGSTAKANLMGAFGEGRDGKIF